MRSAVFASQLEQVVDVLGAFNLSEDGKILQRQLNGHFDRVQVEEVNLRLAHKFASQFIWHQSLGALVILQVVATSHTDPFGQILELILQAALLDDATIRHRHLAQAVV